MISPSRKDVTTLLREWSQGDQEALAQLIPLVHEELCRLAHHYMSQERPDNTLQTTALVNEAYIKLVGQRNVRWQNRTHFFAVAAQLMRRILIDHARKKSSLKRGGGALRRVVTDVADLAAEPDSDQIVKLDQLIQRLEREEPRTAEVLKLRYYAGLSVEDTAAATGLSARTVKREWRYARAWMIQAMQ